ncbi:hypothetical protein Tco_1473329 [Tanacetum coccineum]
MKVVEYLTTQPPPSPHVENSHPKGVYSYYNPGINDLKRHYGFKPGLLGKSVSLGVDISNWEMFDDDWGLQSKEVSPLGEELRPKAKHNLFRGGKQTPSLSAPWIAEGTSKDGDEVDIGMGKSGGVPDGGVSALVWEGMICGDGEWEVDRASALSQESGAALYPNGYVGLASGGDDTCNGDSIGGCGGEGI